MVTLLRINRDNDDSRRCWLIGHPTKDVRVATPTGKERRSVQRQQNITPGTGWKEKKFEDGSNAHVEWSGEGTRDFGSILEAFRFKNSLSAPSAGDQPHPWSGDCVLRMPTGDDTFEEVKIPGALLSLDPIMGGGQSLNLSYNIKGPRVEFLRSGERCSMTVPVPSLGALKFYGRVDGADPFTDGVESLGWSGSLEVPAIGWIFNVQRTNSGIGPATVSFEVVTPSGSASGGRTPIDYPVHSNLAQVATALELHLNVTADVVTTDGPRDYILITYAGTPGPGGVHDSTIASVVHEGAFDVYVVQNQEINVLATLVIGAATLMIDQSA
ncbi:MAG: hypothetical protein V4662_12100 [Verrucomicrobiota bacterium]